MDAKNLEVLRNIKAAIETARTEERPAVRSSCGFSPESEAVFRAIAQKNLATTCHVKASTPKPKQLQKGASARVSPRWETRTCRFCKSEFQINLHWERLPIMCRGCRTERRQRYEVPEGDTVYTETKVFNGGGPGTGKRH